MISYWGGATLLILLGSTPTRMVLGITCTHCLTESMFGMLTYQIMGG